MDEFEHLSLSRTASIEELHGFRLPEGLALTPPLVAHNKRRAQVQLGNAVEFHTACALFRAGLRGTSPPGPPSPPLAAVGQRLDRLEAALGKRVRDLEEEVRKLKASRNN